MKVYILTLKSECHWESCHECGRGTESFEVDGVYTDIEKLKQETIKDINKRTREIWKNRPLLSMKDWKGYNLFHKYAGHTDEYEIEEHELID